MSHHHEDKKNKKKEQAKKNRRNQEIFNAFRIMRGESERLRDLDEERGKEKKDSPETGGEERVWSEKVNTMRNRLTGKQRDSKERWNRFAGTEGGGGRGL